MSSKGRTPKGKLAQQPVKHAAGQEAHVHESAAAHAPHADHRAHDPLGKLLASVDASDGDAVTAAGGSHLGSMQEGFRVDRVVETVTPSAFAGSGEPADGRGSVADQMVRSDVTVASSEPTAASPEPMPTPAPVPAPTPPFQPQGEPVPGPAAPSPAPAPEPAPEPDPAPTPAPAPEPAPEPAPVPPPSDDPAPEPPPTAPEPEPTPDPVPSPQPEPEPAPVPAPEPEPEPEPEPGPAPTPAPAPAPEPQPTAPPAPGPHEHEHEHEHGDGGPRGQGDCQDDDKTPDRPHERPPNGHDEHDEHDGHHGHDGHPITVSHQPLAPPVCPPFSLNDDEPQAVIQVVAQATVLIPNPLSLLTDHWPLSGHEDAHPNHDLLTPPAAPLVLKDLMCDDQHDALEAHLQHLNPIAVAVSGRHEVVSHPAHDEPPTKAPTGDTGKGHQGDCAPTAHEAAHTHSSPGHSAAAASPAEAHAGLDAHSLASKVVTELLHHTRHEGH